QLTPWAATSARAREGSNRLITTRWLPLNRPCMENTNGALWYSGPGTSCTPLGCMLKTAANPALSGAVVPSCPATMILGRPVLPPDVGAFQAAATRSGNGSSDTSGAGSKPPGTLARPGWSPG